MFHVCVLKHAQVSNLLVGWSQFTNWRQIVLVKICWGRCEVDACLPKRKAILNASNISNRFNYRIDEHFKQTNFLWIGQYFVNDLLASWLLTLALVNFMTDTVHTRRKYYSRPVAPLLTSHFWFGSRFTIYYFQLIVLAFF